MSKIDTSTKQRWVIIGLLFALLVTGVYIYQSEQEDPRKDQYRELLDGRR